MFGSTCLIILHVDVKAEVKLTMTITVKFFSSLRESLNLSSESINPKEVDTVADAWNVATNGATMPDNILVAINMDYVERNHVVNDGDEVAFFPPVTGG